MRQRPANGRHGFVFHEACWALLQEFYHPGPVPLARLLEICNSLPFPLRGAGVSWGHDYGGLVILDNQNHYPWEDQLVERDEDSIECQHARENLYDVPKIQQLLKEPQQSPSSRKDFSFLRPISEREDCFIRFPWEIREELAVYLPIADVLSLRRASRAFVHIFSSQPFWASRFKANSERGFLFETRNSREPRDWRSLYRRTNNVYSPPGLQNRKRVWNLIQSLANIIHVRWNHSSELSRWDLSTAGLRWKDIAGDLRQEESARRINGFDEGCRLFHKQCVFIPDLLSQIAFSIIRVGNTEYITGIRLIPSKGADIYLGYKAKGKELSLDVTVLRGFCSAVGSRGIQALQIINDKGYISPWFGCPKESPKTRRLVVLRSVAAIEASFDVSKFFRLITSVIAHGIWQGYKMVSLGVAEKFSPGIEMSIQTKTLRDSALWYPDIPESGLCLNDDSFTGEDPSAIGYRPLCLALFGGPGGIYLRSLTEISVTRLGPLCSIDFHYNTDKVPAEWCKLGRHKCTEYEQVMRFAIDGPGGEIIDTVEVDLKHAYGEHVYSFSKQGKLRSFKASQVISKRVFHFTRMLPANVFEHCRYLQIAGGLSTFNPHRIRQMSLR